MLLCDINVKFNWILKEYPKFVSEAYLSNLSSDEDQMPHDLQPGLDARWDPLTRPINNACSDSGHKFELSSITQAQSEQQEKFQQRRKNLPELWDGFT